MVFKSTMFVLKLTDKRKIRIYKKRHGTGKKKKNKTKQNKTKQNRRAQYKNDNPRHPRPVPGRQV
jgi:hypothetical protein